MRDSQTAIIKLRKTVLKVPLSFSACKEILREKKNLPDVKKDSHFSNFLIDGYFLGGIILCNPCLRPAGRDNEDMSLIKEYFKFSFRNSKDWKLESLEKVIEHKYFLDLVSESIPNDKIFWSQYLGEQRIPESSSHGDLHLDNILVKEEKLFFIDWIRYRKFSSRYFDLIDFFIFFNKKSFQSWMDFWLEEFVAVKREIFGVNIEKKYFSAYAIWKVSEELKILNLRGKLSKQKRKKYVSFLVKIRQMI